MTQAYNLSQLANKVNTSGQLDASTGLVNIAPVANGGTGKATNTSGALLLGAGTAAMTELSGATAGTIVYSNGAGWTAQPAGIVGGNYVMTAYTSPATWTKPAGLKAVKVTVVGGGGTGGTAVQTTSPNTTNAGSGGGGGTAYYYSTANTLPATVSITAGAGTNSFGALASATAGSIGNSVNGQNGSGGAGGTGSGGAVNIQGQRGAIGSNGIGGGTTLSGGQGQLYGGGGAGGSRTSNGTTPGSAGAAGIVIVEEFY